VRRIHAHFLPSLTTPKELAGGDVVVIDVLRATTVIVHALAAGARQVVPCRQVDQARRIASTFAREQVVLGGERGGLPIEGFDLGNSPSEYTAETVGGKTLVFTTSNGTLAMMSCPLARRVVIGAFVNLSAVAENLKTSANVHLLCAGTLGEVTREDVLLAGALVERWTDRPHSEMALNDQATIARDAWRSVTSASLNLPAELRNTQGGRNVVRLGLEPAIDDAARIDRFAIVPELDPVAMRIRGG